MAAPAYSITVEGWDQCLACPDGERVLVALERAGALLGCHPPVGCRRGGCGVCRVQVLSGSYETGRMSRAHVTEAEEAEGYALACCLYAKTDLTLRFTGKRQAAAGQASRATG